MRIRVAYIVMYDISTTLDGMRDTMTAEKPPRITALRELHDAEDRGPFSILIGTILSARTRDENTAKVVRALFDVYSTPAKLAAADYEDVKRIIKSIGFYRVKAKRIMDVAKIIVERYDGQVPDDMEGLISLPGVGRKTANCVLVYAFEKPAIPVDIHVHRISNRLGIVDTKTPEETEMELQKIIPQNYWLEINDTFVMYGQNICKPISPMCNVCRIQDRCAFYSMSAALKGREPPPKSPPQQ